MEQENRGGRLINEAIKRILLDVVVRGHGDRLIGRWSREPELQQFLEQVPYLLDRINQLHLACTRAEHHEPGQIPHHYHKHQNHHHHHHHHHPHHCYGRHEDNDDEEDQPRQTSLSDFTSLIGADLHWLVRTRDALGLTPLHKAILFNNRPIVEYILDRYPDELAPVTWPHGRTGPVSSTRLIDAQDKYGRTALHYAAALLGQAAAARRTTTTTATTRPHRCDADENYHTVSHLYHFLVSKGASMRVADFKGKTAPHYVRHPNELRTKSIVHLSNKLNANYQANVLSRTLRASSSSFVGPLSGGRPFLDQQEMVSLAECVGGDNNLAAVDQGGMSISCNDLTAAGTEPRDSAQLGAAPIRRSHSTMQESEAVEGAGHGQDHREPSRAANQSSREALIAHLEPSLGLSEGDRADCSSGDNSTMSFEHLAGQDGELALKQLRQERLQQVILSQRDRLRLKRCLNEGVLEKVDQLLMEGLGSHLVREANLSCWNQQCRRHINRIIPDKLAKLDQLHELIALNQLLAVRSLLQREPILARMLRPYKSASMSALHLAVHLDRKVLVKYLIESFPELVQQRDSHGATCLHWAAKCLRHDRLYCWLLDRFGAQLEQVRDSRGRSAANYRQQALRLSTFGETHARPRDSSQPSASELMGQNQELSNRLLALSGSPAKLNQPTRRGHKLPSKQPSNKSAPPDESPTTLASQIQPQSTRPAEQQHPSSEVAKINRLVSSASTGSQPAALQHERRLSEQSTRRPGSGTSGSSSRQSCSDNVFVDELAQLADVDMLDEDRTTATTSSTATISSFRDSALALAGSQTGSGRPESASSRQRLDAMIIESIRAENYKKLEHLILAGCGERLLRVYGQHFGASKVCNQPADDNNNNSSQMGERFLLSGKMQEFLDKTVLEQMDNIGKIYELVHRCYGTVKVRPRPRQQQQQQHQQQHRTSSPLEAPGTPRADKSGDTAANSVFHKLCNLLDRKRLIMSRDSHGACLLHVALVRSDGRLADYLLRRHPEAASAPDHDSRTALHYAAIVLAAHNGHGTFRLTCAHNTSQLHGGGDRDKASSDAAAGFWLVDGQTRLTYDKLCLRYGEPLLEARDKRGLTCGQYLERAHSAVSSANLPSSSSSMVEAAKVFADCCPDYAQLLARYNYCLLFDSDDDDGDDDGSPARLHSDGPKPRSRQAAVRPTIVQQQTETAHDIGPTSDQTAVKSLTDPDQDNNDKDEVASARGSLNGSPQKPAEREDTCDNNNNPREDTAPESSMGRRSTGGSQRRARPTPRAADLTLNGHLIASSSAADQLAEPPPQSPTVLQVAPKPTVGSEHGYPPISHNLSLAVGSANSHNSNHHHSQHHHRHHHHGHSHSSSLLGSHRERRRLVGDDLAATIGPESGALQKGHRHHHHHQHRRQHHHQNHRRAHRNRTTMNDSLVGKPLVGGVIVPTIIHNDKMDEIETYDIIYRQPPVSPIMQAAIEQEGLSSSSSSSGSSSSGSSSSSISSLSARSASNTGSPEKAIVEQTGPKSDSASGSSSSDDDNDDDDDDERVERLSDEFESRVRREKSELRAKVDQIMNEIKLSAKSGKSSRFLVSPLNNHNDESQTEANQTQGAASSSQRVAFSMDGAQNGTNPDRPGQVAANQQRHLSLSSTGSLCVSRTASAASSSSSSSNSTTSSGSSTCSSSGSSALGSATARANKRPQPSHQQQQPPHKEESNRAEVAVKQHPMGQAGGQVPPVNVGSGSQLASKNTYGQTYLHFIASRSQNAATLYKVLKHGSYLIGERDIFYRTARDVAIQFNLANNVQILDKYIIDLFVEGKTQLLRHLLNQGYSPLIHVSDPDGNDIMLILKLLKLDRLIHFLLQMADFQRWRDELHTFVRNGYLGGVSELLRKHKDLVRAKSVHARTSLHLAVLFDRVKMVDELIGADPMSVHETDNMGRTALHYTYGLQSMANIELIRDKLLAAGATLEVRDVKMRTPKYYYIFKREIEEIRRIELELN